MVASRTIAQRRRRRMVDTFTPEERSRIMSRVRSRDTRPELLVRSYLHRAGLRFKVDDSSIPGRPDLVLSKYRCAIFVHGCFWHRHQMCKFATKPVTRVDFWRDKFETNVRRDRRTEDVLSKLGWRVIVIWGCEVSSGDALDQLFWKIVAT